MDSPKLQFTIPKTEARGASDVEVSKNELKLTKKKQKTNRKDKQKRNKEKRLSIWTLPKN